MNLTIKVSICWFYMGTSCPPTKRRNTETLMKEMSSFSSSTDFRKGYGTPTGGRLVSAPALTFSFFTVVGGNTMKDVIRRR